MEIRDEFLIESGMRLLFVFDISFDKNGPSVHLLKDILKKALERGCFVHVILKKTNELNIELPIEFKTNSNFTFTAIHWPAMGNSGFVKRYLDEIKYANECGREVLSLGHFDSVFLQSNTATYFYMRHLKKLNCRIVYNIQDIFPYNLKLSAQLPMSKILFPIFRKLQNVGYLMADEIITISDDMKQTLVEDGISPEKIAVVYNWSYADSSICIEQINQDNLYDLRLDPKKYNVVYAGNIGKMQNVEMVAETARKMSDFSMVHFYIIGDGVNKENVKKIVAGLENVTILPMQPSKYAESIYAQADLNIISLVSGGIKTALPSKTATVLRVNRPVIFCIDEDSKTGDLFSSMEGVYFCDCKDKQSLCNKIIELSGKPKIDIRRTIIPDITNSNSNKYIDIMVSPI